MGVPFEARGEIAIVWVDNPPVNAIDQQVRRHLLDGLRRALGDAAFQGVVIACRGRTFLSGADIKEFGRGPLPPSLHEVIGAIDESAVPTVAAIHGTALGGGLELALGCHFRVADKRAKLGLPEVKLGLLPGAGGTIRLPYLVGSGKALKMIVSGTPVTADEAFEDGLLDAVFEDDLVASAVAFAGAKAIDDRPIAPVRSRRQKVEGADLAAFDREAAELTKRARGLEAPVACVQAVRNAVTLSFDEALAKEREFFDKLVDSDQSRAQRHLFFAEREAAKVADVGKDVRLRDIRRAAVIGAGTMGGGIAMALANGGIPVTILEMNREALDSGLATIEKNYATSVSRGSLSEADKSKRMARLTGTTDYADLADCDIVIEAVFEDMAVKKEVFGKLGKLTRKGAILATNTSYLDVNEIAAGSGRPEDVAGTHFFSPANVMKLLEIARGEKTAPDVLATLLSLAKRIGKVPVVVGVCHGFVGNRMLAARSAELENLLLEGATPREIDKAFTDFGWPMGPFQMADLAGLDIGWRNRKALGKTAVIADTFCEQGRFGQKTGRGFYLYDEGSRTPKPDPDVENLIDEKARERGVERRAIPDDEIIERTHYPLVNEGARILEERIAARASDIDVVWVYGYGFSIGKGGPMFWAEREGLAGIVERLDYWHDRTGKDVFKPAPLLKGLAISGGSFSS
jgi:3-hydroxyacyl-CoA dehydrogenase